MNRVFMAALEILSASIILVPVYFILNRFCFRNWKRSALYCLFSFYLVAVWVLMGLPSAAYIRFEGNFNFIPFVPMLRDLKNSILNVLLFVPVGLFLPILCDKFRNRNDLLKVSFAISTAGEVLQIFTFRATDVNDVIANVLGSLLGFAIAKCFLRRCGRSGDNHRELYGILMIVFLTMFFLQCYLSRFLWEGILY